MGLLRQLQVQLRTYNFKHLELQAVFAGDQGLPAGTMDPAAAHRAEAQELMLQLLMSGGTGLLPGAVQDPTAFQQQITALQLMSANSAMPMLFPTPVLPAGFQALPGMALQPPLGALVPNPNGVSGAFVARPAVFAVVC